MKLTLAQAAEQLGVHPDTLRNWGKQDPPVGPPFTRTAGGHRRYDQTEMERWAAGLISPKHIPISA